MKKLTSNYYLQVIILIGFLLLLLKIDYRINDFGKFNPSDDASYMYHAYTIGLDFDLDYSNQIISDTEVVNPNFYINEDSYVPKHFIGSGILAAPVVFIGSIFHKINSNLNF